MEDPKIKMSFEIKITRIIMGLLGGPGRRAGFFSFDAVLVAAEERVS